MMSSSLMCLQTQHAAMRLLPCSAAGVGRVAEVVLRRFRTEPAGCCHLAGLFLAGQGVSEEWRVNTLSQYMQAAHTAGRRPAVRRWVAASGYC